MKWEKKKKSVTAQPMINVNRKRKEFQRSEWFLKTQSQRAASLPTQRYEEEASSAHKNISHLLHLLQVNLWVCSQAFTTNPFLSHAKRCRADSSPNQRWKCRLDQFSKLETPSSKWGWVIFIGHIHPQLTSSCSQFNSESRRLSMSVSESPRCLGNREYASEHYFHKLGTMWCISQSLWWQTFNTGINSILLRPPA